MSHQIPTNRPITDAQSTAPQAAADHSKTSPAFPRWTVEGKRKRSGEVQEGRGENSWGLMWFLLAPLALHFVFRILYLIERQKLSELKKIQFVRSCFRIPYLCTFLVIFFFLTSSSIAASTQPTTLSQSSSINTILDALDSRGQFLKDFSAKVTLTDADAESGEATTHTGSVLLQRLGPDNARIRVEFKTEQRGNTIKPYNHVYTLDKGVLDERNYDDKKETTGQLLKPGQKLDLFKLGEGPFPLPLGQKREDVLQNFAVQKISPAPDDPPNTIHLQLTPKDNTPLASRFKTIDVWVDIPTQMPRRIQTEDITQSTIRTTDLTDVKLNTGLTDKDFSQPPLPNTWDIVEGPWGQ